MQILKSHLRFCEDIDYTTTIFQTSWIQHVLWNGVNDLYISISKVVNVPIRYYSVRHVEDKPEFQVSTLRNTETEYSKQKEWEEVLQFQNTFFAILQRTLALIYICCRCTFRLKFKKVEITDSTSQDDDWWQNSLIRLTWTMKKIYLLIYLVFNYAVNSSD